MNSKIVRNQAILRPTMSFVRAYSSDTPSGGGGSIRSAGGAFAKQEYAREEEYFRRKQKEQVCLEFIHSNLVNLVSTSNLFFFRL